MMQGVDIELLVSKIIDAFPNQIRGVLQYGSTLENDQESADLDIMIILKTREHPQDIVMLREISHGFPTGVDLQMVSTEDIHSESFSHGTHGEYFVRFMKQAKVLYGYNEFLNHEVYYSKQVSSVIRKIRYYYQSAKTNIIHTDVELKAPHYRQLKKRLQLIMVDFWLVYSGEVISRYDMKKLSEVCVVLRLQDSIINIASTDLWGAEVISTEQMLDLYQKVYYGCLDILETKPAVGITTVQGLFVKEYKVQSDRLVIIVPGLPNQYEETETPLFFNIHKYDVVNFQYKGSGLSANSLHLLPEADLEALVSHYQNVYTKILIVGCSFGGYVALKARYPDKVVDTVITVSGVVNFPSVVSIDTLPEYLTVQRSHEYRWERGSIEKYIQESLYPGKLPQSVYMFHGTKDAQIKVSEAEEFAQERGYMFTQIDESHISLRKFSRNHLFEFYKIINISK